jgi:enterochelin esterase family protein
MRYWWIGSSLVMILAMGRAARAQQTDPPDDFRPCSTNIVGQQYPQVDSRRQVRFRIYAPKAQSIQVFDTDLVKGKDGYFTGITPPLDPGFHYYQITIDGVAVADPNGESFFGAGSFHSGIEIPEPGVDFYDNKDVPHGEIRSHWYKANSNGQNRQAYIYTPPDYDKDPAKRYPVLYLQHGAWEDRRAWPQQGRVNFILDNLIAEGKAVPMIVVMEDGGIAAIKRLAPAATRPGAGPPKLNMPFTSQIITDVIPMVDSTYRTIPDRDHRAIAGLSLGGTQTYQITQANLDKFAYIGVFSAPFGFPGVKTGYNGLLRKPEEFGNKVKVFFISMGSKEDSRTGRAPAEQLKAAGIKHVIYYEAPGTAHEFQTWRKSLHEFAPLLFQR